MKQKPWIGKGIYLVIKYIFQKDKDICPRCGSTAMKHGFHPDDREYCTKCGLWLEEYFTEEDVKKIINEMKKDV